MRACATEVLRLQTTDRAFVSGVLRVPDRGADTVVTLMHPREDATHNLFTERLLDLGVAVWVQNTRSVNNDIRLLHEQALLDVAAGQAMLEERGFGARLFLGHSGGATLFAFYQQQAHLAPSERLSAAPDGTAVDLAGASMPIPDGTVFVAPHPGQGVVLQRLIDPSVVEESDPWATDPDLDPYHARNGFRPAPESSTYAPEFIERYRAAQAARIRRLDATAAEAVAEARRRGDAASASGHVADRRRSLAANIMIVHRTDAELRSVDLSIDPNQRPYGSLYGRRPDVANFGLPGLCRITTPASWMSTWSATTSRANFLRNAPGVSSPTLLIELTGDQGCYPADAREMYTAVAAHDKRHVQVAGTHFGGAIAPGEPTGVELAIEQMQRWLNERFPT